MSPEMWSRTKAWFLPGMEHLEENDEGKLRGLMRKLRSEELGKQPSYSQAEKAKSFGSMFLLPKSGFPGESPRSRVLLIGMLMR